LVNQYLGRVAKSEKPVPRDIPREPPQTKEKRVTLQEEWPLPAVVVAHHITFDGNPDSYPLHIASKILSDGQSSRIYRKLVYESAKAKAEVLAHAVATHHDIKTPDGEFDIFQNMSPADVQRVARTYFTPENRIVITIVPKGSAQ